MTNEEKLHEAWEELKREMKNHPIFGRIYKAMIWTLDKLSEMLDRV